VRCERGDIDGDGKTDVCGRSIFGIECMTGDGNAGFTREVAAGPQATQDWTLQFTPIGLISTQFDNTTEIPTSPSYYRTFSIANHNVCIRRSTGVWCAAFDLGERRRPVGRELEDVGIRRARHLHSAASRGGTRLADV
jgi:hypothetical protein